VPGDGLEVFNHDLSFLRDIVRVQPHEACQRVRGLLALDVRIVLAGLEQLIVRRVRRIIFEHIEDESLLDRLPHGVAVGRPSISVEEREGPDWRRGAARALHSGTSPAGRRQR
jgi:hypothetical protein